MSKPSFSIYLGGSFGEFGSQEVLRRQNEFESLLDPSVYVMRPKHQHAYEGLGAHTEAVLTTRDALMVQRCDVLVLDFLAAKTVSRGGCVEIGWADAWRKPVVILAEEGNLHRFNMSTTLARFFAQSREEGARIVNAMLT